ncbi:hypothetical protein SteCoe_11442 [Stentor coeruleus]|uniref:EF-hand domain-containing protein n=1 Tax=Stentor coeruleus TaxID=5963 RepID=A0A1R2CD39_9CILI|nr:hypothetical protein SteCoe_11442 [Stentor coeruleus]
MGCIEGRADTEEQLRTAEVELGFKDIPVDLINTTMRKYSYKSKINQAQLERINYQLKLSITPPNLYVQAFLNSLRKPDGTFSLREFLVLGILLGKGLPEEKASIMYQIFDEMLDDSIERNRLTGEVFKTMSKISIEITPHLIRHNNEYIVKLFEKQSVTIKSIIDRFPENLIVCSEKDFIKHICFIENGNLLTTSGWRAYSLTLP